MYNECEVKEWVSYAKRYYRAAIFLKKMEPMPPVVDYYRFALKTWIDNNKWNKNTLDNFLKDCSLHNIKYLVFNSMYEAYSEDHNEIYSEELQVKKKKKIAEVKDYKIFRVEF